MPGTLPAVAGDLKLPELLGAFRDRVAPGLLRLLDQVASPPGTAPRLRAGVALLRSCGLAAAPPLEELEGMLADLGVLYLSRFAYSGCLVRHGYHRLVELEMEDRGGGCLVRAAIAHVGMIASCAHGAAGLTVARRCRSRRDDLIGEIAGRMRPHLES